MPTSVFLSEMLLQMPHEHTGQTKLLLRQFLWYIDFEGSGEDAQWWPGRVFTAVDVVPQANESHSVETSPATHKRNRVLKIKNKK
jgi:hypothetical protein